MKMENHMNNVPDKAHEDAGALTATSPVDAAATSPWLPASQRGHGLALQQRFQELVDQWKEATLLLSSITDMAMHPAYQQIIGMGQAALPLLFAELRREPDHWFWALQAITGVNPVPVQYRGDTTRMTQAWLAWADQQGL
jgi:hypothetical protein